MPTGIANFMANSRANGCETGSHRVVTSEYGPRSVVMFYESIMVL